MAPAEWADREVLWNAVEKTEKTKDSRLAREFVVALPIELGRDQWITLLTDFIQVSFVAEGMCTDVAIHNTDGHNPHAHIMVTVRPLKENGTWQQKTEKRVSDMDAMELDAVRHAIRPDREYEALQRLQASYGKRFDPKLLTQSRKDIAELLGKDTEQTSICQRLQQTTGQQERPYRTRKLTEGDDFSSHNRLLTKEDMRFRPFSHTR